MKKAAAVALLVVMTATAQELGTLPVQELVLPNGFRLLVVEVPDAPRVAASLWYRVGGIGEAQGEHGSTHFLEHAIHQGTATVGTKDFEAEQPTLREIYETEQELLKARNAGRNRLRERRVFYDELDWPTTPEMEALRRRLYELEDENSRYRVFWAEYNWYRRYGARARHFDPVPATTGSEHMDISMDLPKDNLELLFRLEADRMVNAVLRGWEAQRFTVLEQILNGLSRPERRFSQALNGATGLAHPVYNSAGGHLRDFAHFDRARMLDMYDTYFVPENATLVLVGGVEMERVAPLAEKYFGAIPEGPPAPARMDYEAEPVPGGSVRLAWSEPMDPRLIVRFRMPGVGLPDRPPFDTLAALLRGSHGMLQDALRGAGSEIGNADVQVSAPRYGSPYPFSLTVLARRDEDLPAIEVVALETIEDLRQGRIDADRLARARRALRVEWEQLRSNRSDLAWTLGRFQVMDSWRTLAAHMEARQTASIEDLQRIAQLYFVPSNRIIGVTRRNPERGVKNR